MRIDNKAREIAAMGVLIVGLVTSGCGTQQAAPRSALPEVAVVTAHPEQVVLTTELPGRTSAYFMAEIRPQVNGIIQKRLFTEGSDVKAGQVLYQIDPAPYRAAYDNAVANLAAMRKAADRRGLRLRRRLPVSHASALPWGLPGQIAHVPRSSSRAKPSLPASATRM